jgi:hypothetical protein
MGDWPGVCCNAKNLDAAYNAAPGGSALPFAQAGKASHAQNVGPLLLIHQIYQLVN